MKPIHRSSCCLIFLSSKIPFAQEMQIGKRFAILFETNENEQRIFLLYSRYQHHACLLRLQFTSIRRRTFSE